VAKAARAARPIACGALAVRSALATFSGLAARRLQVGGQAVMEGVMMRGVDHWSLAVRKPDDGIFVDSWPLVSWMKRYRVLRWPVVRGVTALIESLVIGIRALTMSANLSLGEEQEELSRREIGVTIVIAFGFAILLFFLAPLGITRIFKEQLGAGFWFWLVEGLVRVAIFVVYLLIVTRFRDLRRVFEYHGAEHRVVFNFESGQPVTVENAQTFSTFHPRCGTSFLLVVMLVSIGVYTLLPFDSFVLKLAGRILLLPLIAGLSYELIRYAAKHRGGLLATLTAPGLWMQRITTKPPSADQTAVAIEALQRAMALEQAQGGKLVIA
jgi:uncharacterized protein YqhQ